MYPVERVCGRVHRRDEHPFCLVSFCDCACISNSSAFFWWPFVLRVVFSARRLFRRPFPGFRFGSHVGFDLTRLDAGVIFSYAEHVFLCERTLPFMLNAFSHINANRYESLKHCKWVDEVVEDAPWVVEDDFIAAHQVSRGCCRWDGMGWRCGV